MVTYSDIIKKLNQTDHNVSEVYKKLNEYNSDIIGTENNPTPLSNLPSKIDKYLPNKAGKKIEILDETRYIPMKLPISETGSKGRALVAYNKIHYFIDKKHYIFNEATGVFEYKCNIPWTFVYSTTQKNMEFVEYENTVYIITLKNGVAYYNKTENIWQKVYEESEKVIEIDKFVGSFVFNGQLGWSQTYNNIIIVGGVVENGFYMYQRKLDGAKSWDDFNGDYSLALQYSGGGPINGKYDFYWYSKAESPKIYFMTNKTIYVNASSGWNSTGTGVFHELMKTRQLGLYGIKGTNITEDTNVLSYPISNNNKVTYIQVEIPKMNQFTQSIDYNGTEFLLGCGNDGLECYKLINSDINNIYFEKIITITNGELVPTTEDVISSSVVISKLGDNTLVTTRYHLPPAYYDSNVESKFLLNDHDVNGFYFDLFSQNLTVIEKDNVTQKTVSINTATDNPSVICNFSIARYDGEYNGLNGPSVGVKSITAIELNKYNYILYQLSWNDISEPKADFDSRAYLYLEDAATGTSETIKLIGVQFSIWCEIPESWKNKKAYVGFMFGGYRGNASDPGDWQCEYTLSYCKLV